MIMSPGRVCVKIAGRESVRICVIVDKVDDKFVIVDGFVKRRKCNIKHLEPLPYTIEVNPDMSREEIQKRILAVTKGARNIRELERKLKG